MAKRTETYALIPRQKEENTKLDSKDKDKDTNMKGGDTIHPTMEEARYNIEEDSELASTQSNTYTWIQDNIKMRKCNTFIPSHIEELCMCGYKKCDHPATVTETNSAKLEWNYLYHTDKIPTNAYGEMAFASNEGNTAKFVRVDVETDMDTIWNLMTTTWRMGSPNILISVTGGEGDVKIKRKLKHWFQRNLMDAANKADAWIITGGTHTHVTKCVGDAVKDYRLTHNKSVPVIGIVPWGVIKNRRLLQNTKGEYSVGKTMAAPGSFLDQHHSHFIMVDDGTQHKYGTEINFRALLQEKISKEKPAYSNADVISLGSVLSAVPTVILVLNGGPSTLEMVETALERNTSAVIIKGSGGVADVLADALRLMQNDDKDNEQVYVEMCVYECKSLYKIFGSIWLL